MLRRPGLALGAADLMKVESCFDIHPAVGVLIQSMLIHRL